MKRYLLDTNIVIALFNNDEALAGRLPPDAEFAISIVTYGELLYGALYSSQVVNNVLRLRSFAGRVEVIDSTLETATAYAEIAAQLRRDGRPLPDNDVWIAAVAREHQMVLISRDRHFSNVRGLTCESW